MLKAQSDVISAVIIVAIALSLASTGYLWGMPLIQKRQSIAVTERVFNYFDPANSNSLPNTIEHIANNGGEKPFQVDVDGFWILNETENSIQFTFSSKTSNMAVNTQYPISLTRGVQCIPSPSPPNGTIGLDSSSVVCANALTYGDVINITYKVWFRELYENPFTSSPKGVRIKLVKDPASLSTSTSRSIKISFSASKTEIVDGKTLITKEIKILLI